MARKTNHLGKSCQICGSQHAETLRSAAIVRHAVVDLIRQETGKWDENGWICLDDLQRFQHRYVEEVLKAEKGELTQLEEEVLDSLRTQETLSANADLEFDAGLTPGQKLADRIADFGGSWTFLILFGLVIFAWMVLNSFVLATRPFDPYPYILLNLVLSCLAAIQAPVIMMSQNRQAQRDRANAEHDYVVNLRAELEIMHLHDKVDAMRDRQMMEMLQRQEETLSLLREQVAKLTAQSGRSA